MKNLIIVFITVILLGSLQLSYADDQAITVNVPNAQGGYTSLIIQKSGNGFVGPQGEYYSQFPSVSQLQVVYSLGTPSSNGNAPTKDPQVNVITVEPPALPVYEQPAPPDTGYIWVPGYWAYSFSFQDYYWVPGTWVMAPSPGLLWTPGYWYWRGGYYVFRGGYWGANIGFYGGINYGHGYGGTGFSGGAWGNGKFVNHPVNETAGTNSVNATNNTVSFNGGPGGINAKPTPEEKAAMKGKHFPPTAEQKLHLKAARKNPELRASENHGKPSIAATAKPGVFKGEGVVTTKRAGAFYNKTKAMKSNKGVVTHGDPKYKSKIQNQ